MPLVVEETKMTIKFHRVIVPGVCLSGLHNTEMRRKKRQK
jgi:hypothetical protein